MGEAAITATCYPLAAYQVSKQNEGKAMVGTFSLRSICLLLLYSLLDSNYGPSGMYMFGVFKQVGNFISAWAIWLLYLFNLNH